MTQYVDPKNPESWHFPMDKPAEELPLAVERLEAVLHALVEVLDQPGVALTPEARDALDRARHILERRR